MLFGGNFILSPFRGGVKNGEIKSEVLDPPSPLLIRIGSGRFPNVLQGEGSQHHLSWNPRFQAFRKVLPVMVMGIQCPYPAQFGLASEFSSVSLHPS